MNVTLDESIAIYARATARRFGTKACEKTEERIRQLARAGDGEGARIHELVRERILEFEQRDAWVNRCLFEGKLSLVTSVLLPSREPVT